MPKQLPVTDVTTPACCTPMVDEALTDAVAADLAKAFKALGDPVRLRLLSLIAARAGGEVCVCDLTDAFAVTGPTISHHLRVLREAGLIDCERRGTWVYYWIIPAALAPLSQLLDTSAVSSTTASPFTDHSGRSAAILPTGERSSSPSGTP